MGSKWREIKQELLAKHSRESESAVDVLRSLESRGVRVCLIDGGKIHVQGALTDDDRQKLRQHRDSLVHWLSPFPSLIGWNRSVMEEWQLERDFLLRMVASCRHAEDRERLLQCANRDAYSEDLCWQAWEEMKVLEAELRQKGRMPETGFFRPVRRLDQDGQDDRRETRPVAADGAGSDVLHNVGSIVSRLGGFNAAFGKVRSEAGG